MSSPSVNNAEVEKPRHPSFWVRDLPFFLVLVLTVIGVAYTSFSNRPIIPLLGIARADDRTCLRRGRVAPHDRQRQQVEVDCNAGLALAGIPARDESAAVAERATVVQRECNRAGNLCPPHPWNVHRRRSCSFMAGFAARLDHGAEYPSHCVYSNFRVDRGGYRRRYCDGSCRSLVALACEAPIIAIRQRVIRRRDAPARHRRA